MMDNPYLVIIFKILCYNYFINNSDFVRDIIMEQNEKALICKKKLKEFMKEYLDNNMTLDEYYIFSEKYYTKYGEYLKFYYPIFDQIFLSIVPDACLYYIDEPGLSFDEKAKLFRKEIEKAYMNLKDL